MSLKLDWNLDGGPPELPDDDDPQNFPSDRPIRPYAPSARSAFFWLIYLGALVMVGWGGFEVGRWRDLYEAHRDNLTTQLNIESRAWGTRDAELYLSTLDPLALPPWREAQGERFVATSPAAVNLRLVDFTTDANARATVRVEVTRDGQTTIEERAYRLVKGSWYHSTGYTRLRPP